MRRDSGNEKAVSVTLGIGRLSQVPVLIRNELHSKLTLYLIFLFNIFKVLYSKAHLVKFLILDSLSSNAFMFFLDEKRDDEQKVSVLWYVTAEAAATK